MLGRAAGRAGHPQLAAGRLQPVGQSGQAVPLGQMRATLPVVGHGDHQPVAGALHRDRRTGVAPLCLATLVSASAMVK